MSKKQKRLEYNHDQPPKSRHNRAVARQNGWKYDPDYDAYRDKQGFVMIQDALPQHNTVDCWR